MKVSTGRQSMGQGRFELTSIVTAPFHYPQGLKSMLVERDSKKFREITDIRNIFKMEAKNDK